MQEDYEGGVERMLLPALSKSESRTPDVFNNDPAVATFITTCVGDAALPSVPPMIMRYSAELRL